MGIRYIQAGVPSLVICCVVLGCAAPPRAAPPLASAPAVAGTDTGLQSTYQQLGRAGGKLMRLNPAASSVAVYAFRGGAGARVGHNHVLSVPEFTGFFYLPPDGVRGARFDIEFRLDRMEIDQPEIRATLGPAFASVVAPEMVAATRANMLGEGNLDADRFPVVRIRSLAMAGEAPKFAARIQIELHGQQRALWVPLDVQGLPDRLGVVGAFVLRQSDFGIKPFSALGGLLAVEDELVLEFKLVGE